MLKFLEASAGIEPANSGFADRRLTTWLRRQLFQKFQSRDPDFINFNIIIRASGQTAAWTLPR